MPELELPSVSAHSTRPPGNPTSRHVAIFGAFVAVVIALAPFVSVHLSSADPVTTYTSVETIPVPPASNYAGAGGGDGWDVSLSSTQVFNVFHHNGVLNVACHQQSDASACYPVRTITDGVNGFSSSSHSGTYFDQASGKLWVYATRYDGTAGVVCVDTTVADVNPNPFCGFVALTAVGEGGITSVPMQVGNHLYAFNYVSGTPSGDQDKLLCFDTSTAAACAGQPFAVNIGVGSVSVGSFPVPAAAVIGDQIIIPIYTGGTEYLACWDDSLQADCAGAWPVAPGIGYANNYGSPFPLLDASGGVLGFCLPTFANECFTLAGASTPTPANMTTAIGPTTQWNGPAVTLGPRIYLASGYSDTVRCYDYSTLAGCANFPHGTPGASFLYTANDDPQRPACLWINSDNGGSQIQNFDAFTGGACGQGAIRVLSSQLIVPQEKCKPVAYRKLEILQPVRADYTDGTVAFADSSGNPIASIPAIPIDASGAVDLTGIGLEAFDSPQFLITINSPSGTPTEVVVRLTWDATYDPECIGDDTTTDPVCGDDAVNQSSETCDGTDDDACPGLCIAAGNANECTCGTAPGTCGNDVVDTGETCDGTADTACPGLCIAPGNANECTCAVPLCGNGTLDPGETCDDGNTVSGCRLDQPQKPLDDCLNTCTRPICKDPARIELRSGLDRFRAHGRIEPGAGNRMASAGSAGFTVRLTGPSGVIFEATINEGIVAKDAEARYRNRAARAGGITRLDIRRRGESSYTVNVEAFGDLSAATADMTLHLLIGTEEWTQTTTWQRIGNRGWLAR